MSLLQYGPFSLNLISTNFYKRTAVYSGPNYLYHRHHISVRAYLNPGTQDNWSGGDAKIKGGNYGKPIVPQVNLSTRETPNPPRVPVPGYMPGSGGTVPGVSSDKALRHALMQPRQQLIYSILGEPILISPAPGFSVDVTGGPMPLSCNVEKVGPRTFVVDFEIQTDVNETTLYLGENRLPYILGHSWTMEHTIDDRWFTARVIEGRVTFRKDLLQSSKLDPDDFRKLLMHPIPVGFKRESVQVRADEDGCTLRYRLLDREWPIWWSNTSISKVELSHSVGVAEKGAYQYLRGETGGRIDGGRASLPSYFATLPIRVGTIKAKAWAQPGTDCSAAAAFAKMLTWARFSAVRKVLAAKSKAVAGRGNEIGIVAHENMGYSIFTFTCPPSNVIFGQAVDLVEQSVVTSAATINNGVTVLTSFPKTPVASLPGDGVSRASYLEKVVGSALQAPLVSPQEPPPATVQIGNNPPSLVK